MLSATCEYAMRIMIALTESPQPLMTSAQVSRSTQVPADYTVKVLQVLCRAGLLKAQRGRGGGFSLRCDPATTCLLDVAHAIDPHSCSSSCPPVTETEDSSIAPLQIGLDEMRELLESRLRSITLQSVIDRAPGSALCEPPESQHPEIRIKGSPGRKRVSPLGLVLPADRLADGPQP